MSEINTAAEPEYATAKIAVWWDMKDCPIPEGYDARRVRPSLEAAFKKLGYSGPVSITAFGDHKQTPGHILRGLSSTGISIAHSITQNICSYMFSDILEWRGRNPPPATMMVISDHLEEVLGWDLARLQQVTKYNFFRAHSFSFCHGSVLAYSAKWVWKRLLGSADETRSALVLKKCSARMFYCKSCSFDCPSLASFRKHLSSSKHILEEISNRGNGELDPETRMWGTNYAAKPEYATAQIVVWWDMIDCPIPEGYDARRVRPSMEGAFKNLGYSGPVSIIACGDHKLTPDHVLRGLSSTGVSVVHDIPEKIRSLIFLDMLYWGFDNPPPATMMVISNHVEDYCPPLVARQQENKYNLFLAYSIRPYKMSILVTSAEWLFDSLLAGVSSSSLATVTDTRRQVVKKCTERGESTGKFSCRSCYCDCKGPDDFRNHLSSKEHAEEEACMYSYMRISEREREQNLKEKYLPNRKRLRKAPRTGFRPFHNHLSLTN